MERGITPLLITADTIDTDPNVRAFLQNPETESSRYRVILFTSVIGNCFDFQIPCDGTFIFQSGIELDAPQIVQMIGRFRQVEMLSIYQPEGAGKVETDWTKIYGKYHKKALRTANLNYSKILGDDWTLPNNVFSDDDKTLLGLMSFGEAMHNHSVKNLRAHTDALLKAKWNIKDALHVNTDPEEDRENVVEKLNEKKRDMEQVFNMRVLGAKPVSDKAYAEHLTNGTLTEEIRIGHLRWQVEKAFNQRINDNLLQDFKGGMLPKAYAFMRYNGNNIPKLMRDDFREIVEHHPIMHRQHKTRTQQLLRLFIFTVFGQHEFDPNIHITEDELEDRVNAFMETNGEELVSVLDWRRKKPIRILSGILQLLGVKYKRHQRRKKGFRYNEYGIDPEALAKITKIAEAIQKTYAPVKQRDTELA